MSEILEYVKGQRDTRSKIREALVKLGEQNISTRAKKAEELTANQVVYNEAIIMMGDDIFELDIEVEALRNQLGEVNENWLNESKSETKLKYDDAKKNDRILNRMRRQMLRVREIR